MKHFYSLLFPGLALLLATGAVSFAAEAPAPRDPKLTVDARLVSMTDDFAFRLYHTLAAKSDKENIFISPTSIELALAMTYNGAEGATRKAMAATLGLQGMTDAELNQANSELLALLQHPDAGVELSIANALWGQQGITFNADFMQRNTTNYQADTRYLDFTVPTSAAKTINKWVSDKTQGMIPTLVNSGDVRNALLVLTNALYFKGRWTTIFDVTKTQDGPFTLGDGTTKTVSMMHKTARWDYLETEQFQAISLPYGNKLIRLYILLPKAGVTLADCAASVTPQSWAQWMGKFTPQHVILSLPRFTADYSTSLKKTLSALGMEQAFSAQADFTGMLPAGDTLHKPYIGDVIHKTALKVDEEGTVAAAATAVITRAMAMRVPRVYTLTVDHPFLLAIRDQPTGTLLFYGSIAQPENK